MAASFADEPVAMSVMSALAPDGELYKTGLTVASPKGGTMNYSASALNNR